MTQENVVMLKTGSVYLSIEDISFIKESNVFNRFINNNYGYYIIITIPDMYKTDIINKCRYVYKKKYQNNIDINMIIFLYNFQFTNILKDVFRYINRNPEYEKIIKQIYELNFDSYIYESFLYKNLPKKLLDDEKFLQKWFFLNSKQINFYSQNILIDKYYLYSNDEYVDELISKSKISNDEKIFGNNLCLRSIYQNSELVQKNEYIKQVRKETRYSNNMKISEYLIKDDIIEYKKFFYPYSLNLKEYHTKDEIIEYYDDRNEKIKMRKHLKNNQLNGTCITYDQNGNILSKEEYIDDKPIGWKYTYDDKKNIIKYEYFKNNKYYELKF